jgi:putative ABC transport system permease protein
VTELRAMDMQLDDNTETVSAATADTLEDSVDLIFKDGDVGGLGDHGLLIDEDVADSNDWKVGDTVKGTFINGTTLDLRLGGIYERNQMLGGYLVSLDTATDGGTRPVDMLTFVRLDDGANAGEVRQRLEDGLANNPAVELKTQSEYTDSLKKSIDPLLYFIYAMLAFATLIAVLGIINTLALSVTERTREIGLMRAIGMSRRQLRRMIRLESVVMSVFGAVLGMVVGLGFGIALQQALADDGITELRIPVFTLVVFVVVSAVVGVIAAVWPAWRAARMDVLKAISTH